MFIDQDTEYGGMVVSAVVFLVLHWLGNGNTFLCLSIGASLNACYMRL